MNGVEHEILWLFVLIGSVTLFSVVIQHLFDRLGLPNLIGYLLLGI